MNFLDLKKLTVCRNLLADPVIGRIHELAEAEEKKREILQGDLAGQLISAAEQKGLAGNLLPAYLLQVLAEGDNTAAHTIEQKGTYSLGLQEALQEDMELLLPLLFIKTSEVTGRNWMDHYQPAEEQKTVFHFRLQEIMYEGITSSAAAQALLEYYCRYGRSEMAQFTAFRLAKDGSLVGIRDFPVWHWDDLIGYEEQKRKLLLNTERFMQGNPANNVLLTGARGTGKSTGVKALASMFGVKGLRLIQITRDQLDRVPELLEKLGAIRNKRFILFFDDLSFDEGESGYKYLKSAIDGSVSSQPENVLIYATSNRRHLLKETWAERNDAPEAEVYRQDSVNESISLADRFGLILHYSMPDQEEYLGMIDHGLRKKGILLEKEELRVLAARWEMEHSGRNGRIAGQFVRWYAGNHKK